MKINIHSRKQVREPAWDKEPTPTLAEHSHGADKQMHGNRKKDRSRLELTKAKLQKKFRETKRLESTVLYRDLFGRDTGHCSNCGPSESQARRADWLMDLKHSGLRGTAVVMIIRFKYLYVWVHAHLPMGLHHGTCVEVEGQSVRFGSFLPPCGSRGEDSGWQAGLQMPSRAEVACWPGFVFGDWSRHGYAPQAGLTCGPLFCNSQVSKWDYRHMGHHAQSPSCRFRNTSYNYSAHCVTVEVPDCKVQ